MYKVLLAEDEPAALRYLRGLIEAHFPELSIAATASDGESALGRARQVEPELILTDVKMPRVDGIEFVAQLKAVLPETPVVIVSGYDDFEYVRKALNTGVVDYILKPVTAQKLSEVLERLTPTLRRNRDTVTLSNVKQLVYGERKAREGSGAGPPDLHVAVLRYGAPPSRFIRELGIGLTDRCVDGWCAVRGRDGNELVLVASVELLDMAAFSSRCTATVNEKRGAYYTLFIFPRPVPALRLANELKSLFDALDHSIVLGLNQVIGRPAHAGHQAGFDHLDASRIEYAVINSNALELERLIRHQVSTWENEMVALVDLSNGARRVLKAVEQVALRRSDEAATESAADELLARAESFRDFGESLVRVAIKVAHLSKGEADGSEQDALFAAIRSYLEGSYSRHHTADSVRARFRISASYLSRLFRDNAGRSFTEYLRRLRIDAAKRLMCESPEMPMKSVARYVGFADPFYFSRVFRSVTGESPTEYSRRFRSE